MDKKKRVNELLKNCSESIGEAMKDLEAEDQKESEMLLELAKVQKQLLESHVEIIVSDSVA